jgi:signal transduction histidine kinase
VSERSKTWVLAVCGLVFAQAVASLLLRQNFQLTVLSDITQCVLLLSATAALLPNIMRNRGRARVFWVLMTLGLALWLSYQLLWCYFEVILRQDVPDPFVGDIVLFLHLVPMMAALALQPHAQQDDRTARLGALDFALLLTLWVYLYFFAVIPWQYAHTDELNYSRSFNVLYLTEKVVFLAGLALVWLQSKAAWRTIYAQWFGASLMYALSSYMANWAIAKQVYYTGSFYDVPLAVSMAWVTAVGLLAQDVSPRLEQTQISRNRGLWAARLGMIAIFSLPLLAAWSMFNTAAPPRVRTLRLIVTLLTMMVMGAMVFLRQHLLDRELMKLLHASQDSFENLKRLQVQLVQSEKLASLGQLVGGAAHELNNPLAAMLGYSDLLIATPLSGEQRVLAERIGQQVRRTKALLSSLLSFAKQVPTEKAPVDLNALARTAVNLSQPQLQVRGIETKLDLAPGLPQVLGDSNQLLQVCLHIANNAIHAMEDSGAGKLTVSTQEQNGSIALQFADNGPGAREPDRVFDPFYTTRPVGQGSGLGLSACYGIVQEHNGRILCNNLPEGGAVFRIELPALSPAPASRLDAHKSPAQTESRPSEPVAATSPNRPPS